MRRKRAAGDDCGIREPRPPLWASAPQEAIAWLSIAPVPTGHTTFGTWAQLTTWRAPSTVRSVENDLAMLKPPVGGVGSPANN